MYKMFVWDKLLAAAGQNGAVAELEISRDLSRLLFKLDSIAFPLLSGLSFDDYDLFSGEELAELVAEMRRVKHDAPAFARGIEAMIGIVAVAQSQGKAVLFDPFQPG